MVSPNVSVNEHGIPTNIDSFANYGFKQDARTGNWDFDKWDRNRWKWEFLRRRDDYRNAYKTAFESLSELPERPPEVADDLLDLYPFGQWPFRHEGAKEFGLAFFFDPRQSDWVALGPAWPDSGLLSGSTSQINLDWFHIPLVFDITRPIKPQLDEAKEILREAVRLRPSKKREKTPST